MQIYLCESFFQYIQFAQATKDISNNRNVPNCILYNSHGLYI